MTQPPVATQPQREFLAVSIEPMLAAHARQTIAALYSGESVDGAIYMIKGLAFRQLRALGERLPVAHLPVFLDHLEHFFHDQTPVL